MLRDLTTVRENIRNREGKRVYFLDRGDQLTSEARDFLARERIEIRPADTAKIGEYRLPGGAVFREKPEHYTHLNGDLLVPKTHPRIAFRGAVDTLEADLLLCQLAVPELRQELGEILDLARKLIRWDVLEEPAAFTRLCGLTEQEQRERSHHPEKYYGQPHFMPTAADGLGLLCLNRCRCSARAAELAAAHAFTDGEGRLTREDILKALNRMSSMLYLLMIRQKKKEGP